jgi:apolipoprotein N-acyltransferase
VLAWGRATRWAKIVAGVLAVWTIAGMLMMDERPATVRVAAVQPGAGVLENVGKPNEEDGWKRLTDSEELARDIAETKRAAEEGAELVVWREGGLEMNLEDPKVNRPIRRVAKDAGVYIAAGWGGKHNGLDLNEVATFSPEGEFLGTYGKSHPGTFAGDLSDRRRDYVVYEAPFGRFGSIICYDLDFTDSARAVARKGANILAVSSADVPGIAQKHYAHLVFRSIETGLPTVKADNTFDSSIIDGNGRIIDRHISPTGSAATLIADIPIGEGTTPYVRFGDWLAWLCVAATAMFTVIGASARLRARRVAG